VGQQEDLYQGLVVQLVKLPLTRQIGSLFQSYISCFLVEVSSIVMLIRWACVSRNVKVGMVGGGENRTSDY
jgi:hypothetical protein